MKKGDIVTINDSSFSRSVVGGKLVHTGVIPCKSGRYVVIETGCKFPTVDEYQARDINDCPASFNDTVIQALDSGKVVFIEERFLRPVLPTHKIMIGVSCLIGGEIVEISDELYREILRQK